MAVLAASRELSNQARKRLARQSEQVANERAAKHNDGSTTAHRIEEMYWKDRTKQPDWSFAFSSDTVLNNVTSVENVSDDIRNTARSRRACWTDRLGRAWEFCSFPLSEGRAAVTFPERPGLVYLPQYLSVEDQRKAIIGCLTEASGPESRTNLDTHYVSPPHGWWKTFCESPDRVLQPRSSFQMRPCRSEVSEGPAQLSESRRVQTDLPPVDNSIHARELADAEGNAKKADPPASETVRPAALKDLIRKLRWTILGLEYHWGTKSYKWNAQPMPMPSTVVDVCKSVMSAIPWDQVFRDSHIDISVREWSSTYVPEAGIVNFYQYKDALTAHVDQSEVDSTRPLISVSLGESAIFLAGGESRNDRPIPFRLESGDVIVMSGPCRRVFHGVPRIIENSMDDRLLSNWDVDDAVKAFIKGTRMNINVRQVF